MMEFITDIINDLIFASDAALVAIVGAALWLCAALCLVMERRRIRKRDLARLEAVGWVPWTGLFMACAIMGGGMLAMALPVVLGNM